MESGQNPKLSISMSKEPDLEDFTTLSLLVVSVFSDSRRIDVDLTITVRFKKALTADLRIFRYSIDDDQEDNLEDRLFPLLLVVVVSFNLPAATGWWWLLRRCVSCTAAVPNSWNLVLQNPQLWILYTLSLENYALILVVRK
jgi:hypothetical protein